MHSLITCRKWLLYIAVLAALMSIAIGSAQAVIINFSAMLNPSTCTFSLDKGTLALGGIPRAALQPATLVAAQPFTLQVRDCSGSDASLTPVVSVSGDGVSQGGKWLFRSSESTAAGVGIMLVKGDAPPNYNQTEVKNGDDLTLADKGVVPLDQNLMFYAGMTCGTATTCATAGAGSLTARILFTLAYR